jgi:hypothetical protein
LQIDEPAALFAVLDSEVEPGHNLVVRESLIGLWIATNAEGRARA